MHGVFAALHLAAEALRLSRTVVTLCRRLLLEAVDCGVHVVWVKVRGHSEEAGNDRAGAAATAGQNGRKSGVRPLPAGAGGAASRSHSPRPNYLYPPYIFKNNHQHVWWIPVIFSDLREAPNERLTLV